MQSEYGTGVGTSFEVARGLLGASEAIRLMGIAALLVQSGVGLGGESTAGLVDVLVKAGMSRSRAYAGLADLRLLGRADERLADMWTVCYGFFRRMNGNGVLYTRLMGGV